MTASLPLANRQFTDLAVLTPAASFAAPGAQAGAFAVAGTHSQSTNWQIDGVNAIDPNVNGPTYSYRIADAIQELTVATTAYSAAFGRASGGEVSVVTKERDPRESHGIERHVRANQFDGGPFGGQQWRAPRDSAHRAADSPRCYAPAPWDFTARGVVGAV